MRFKTLVAAGALLASFGTSALIAHAAATRADGSSVAPVTITPSAVTAGCSIKIDGIEGENSDKGISIFSYSWGLNNASSGGMGSGMSNGKVQMQDFSFTKKTDKSSASLFQAIVTGQKMKSVTFTCKRAGDGATTLTATLSDVMVTSFKTSGDSGSAPTEQLSLNFTKIEYSYSPQKSDGSLDTAIKMTYNVKANVK